MTKINDIYTKAMKTILVITLYFIWPTIIKFISNIININPNELITFVCNIILLIIVVLIYQKDIISSLNKIKVKKLICLFLSLVGVQILTNLISVAIIGVNNHYTYRGLLPAYLDKCPILMGISTAIIYPILGLLHGIIPENIFSLVYIIATLLIAFLFVAKIKIPKLKGKAYIIVPILAILLTILLMVTKWCIMI